MSQLKVGVMIESFRLGVKGGIKKAAEMGADGFQISVTSGEMSPENLSKSARADFLHFAKSQNLEISALCGDLGCGYTNESGIEDLISKTKRIIDLSVDLKVPIITTHIGVIPEDEKAKEWQVMTEALNELGVYAENFGIYLATETGPEDTSLMKRFLDSLKSEAIKVNYDPANLVMKNFDPIKGVDDLKDYIVHTHAKDGKWGNGEVPLGEGDVNFNDYIKAMDRIGYKGFYTIEREVGDNPIVDIVKAKDFLRAL